VIYGIMECLRNLNFSKKDLKKEVRTSLYLKK